MHLFWLQLMWTVLGILFLALMIHYDWRAIFNHKVVIWGIYIGMVLLLLITYFTSPVIRNTRSWIVLGPVNFQPVEFTKIALILLYAWYFKRRHLAIGRWPTIITSLILFALPAGLTLLQPDLGSASILFGVWFGFLLTSGLPRSKIFMAVVAFAILAVLGWNFALKDYHRARIHGLFFPEENALTVNYSVIQAKIAIGSAGFWGKGYGQGSQTQLGFLTEPSNDFVLASLVEEWGLVGGLVAITSLLALIWNVLKVGLRARGNTEKFFALGTAMVFGLHFLINAGSTVGLFPVVGVPFPFLSYGGSNLLTSFFLLAIMASIIRRA
ncbi:MAG: FtsW/RodA/SpoVE family cell cycle protein [Candidatus Liptonbacteria bacterium]